VHPHSGQKQQFLAIVPWTMSNRSFHALGLDHGHVSQDSQWQCHSHDTPSVKLKMLVAGSTERKVEPWSSRPAAYPVSARSESWDGSRQSTGSVWAKVPVTAVSAVLTLVPNSIYGTMSIWDFKKCVFFCAQGKDPCLTFRVCMQRTQLWLLFEW
jgi:hypothetical protein